jgi:hypothetical protein
MVFPRIAINQSSAVISPCPVGANHLLRKRFIKIYQQSFVKVEVTHRLKLNLNNAFI